jgi:hypothetical protein
MRAAMIEIGGALRENFARWLGITIGLAALYNVLVFSVTMVRFGTWPNYVRVHDVAEGARLILQGTPDVGDAAALLADEIWIEIGYLHPNFRIAEWSFNVMPARLALLLALGALVATYLVLPGRNCIASRRQDAAAIGAGAALVGLTSVTLTWVVCCATPSWVVGLAMLGLGVSTALAIEPLGAPLTAAGFALLLAGILLRAHVGRLPNTAEVTS